MEDWGTGDNSGPKTFSNSTGFGAGRGFRINKDPQKNPGANSFGEGQGATNRSRTTGSSFGSSRNNFGSSGQSDYRPEERSNGFGGSNVGKGCHKCGQDGHFARDCPQAGSGRGGGGRGCHKCGKEGHFARDCPDADSGDSRKCHKCGKEGHFARECTENGDGGGFGSSGGGFKHPSGDGKSSGCRKCGEEGHFARECPNANNKCFNCGEEGHISKDCENPEAAGKPKRVTYEPEELSVDLFDLGVSQGINFNKYDNIPVQVSGKNPIACISSFEDAGLTDTVMANVRKAKYRKPTPVQKYSIPIVLNGRDLMACAQTGSGKTAAYLLPVLTGMLCNGLKSGSLSVTQEPQALIIAPTRELAIQIHGEARKFSSGMLVKAEVAYGGVSVSFQSRRIQSGCNVLVGTPGRLKQFIDDGTVSLNSLEYLVLDEADRMLDMGFLGVIREIIGKGPSKDIRQTLMFSATFENEIQKVAAEFLKSDYLHLTVGTVGSANTDVTQDVLELPSSSKREKLIEILKAAPNDRTLVFVERKRNADFLASVLSQMNFPTTSIHGDREQRERESALRTFRSGETPVCVATNVAARGLDIAGVECVVNYDLPKDIDEYVHRIGRTGRVGNTGRAISFFDTDNDQALARSLLTTLQQAGQEIPQFLQDEAYSAVGTPSTRFGGKFGSKDVRKYGGAGSNFNSNSNIDSNVTSNFAAEEEVW